MADKVTGQDLIPESGEFDDFAGPIREAHFEKAGENYPKSASGAVAIMLQCRVESDQFEEPVRLGGFKVGDTDKWEVSEDERELTPIKGKTKFNSKSTGGIFVAELMRVAGTGNIESGANLLAGRGFLTTQSGFYAGLDSHWVKREFENPMGKDKNPVIVQIATEYVKIAEIAAPAKAEKKAKADGKFVITPIDLAKLKEIASGKDRKELKAAVIKDAGLKANTALMNDIYSKDLITKLTEAGELILDSDTGKYV